MIRGCPCKYFRRERNPIHRREDGISGSGASQAASRPGFHPFWSARTGWFVRSTAPPSLNMSRLWKPAPSKDAVASPITPTVSTVPCDAKAFSRALLLYGWRCRPNNGVGASEMRPPYQLVPFICRDQFSSIRRARSGTFSGCPPRIRGNGSCSQNQTLRPCAARRFRYRCC